MITFTWLRPLLTEEQKFKCKARCQSLRFASQAGSQASPSIIRSTSPQWTSASNMKLCSEALTSSLSLTRILVAHRHSHTLIDTDSTTEPLVVGQGSGGVFLRNDASIKTSYDFEIDIVTTDGTNDIAMTLSGLKIETVCGLGSTTLTAPNLIPQYQVPGILPVISIQGQFSSSNPTCPVLSHQLMQG
jgi:hypothetical protein